MFRNTAATLIFLLIAVSAVGALAQDPAKQTKKDGDAEQLRVRSTEQLRERSAEQLRERNHDETSGDDANGEIHRHGDEFTGEGGPHGPMGNADVEAFFEAFGMDEMIGAGGEGDGEFAGQLLRHEWGPGDPELDAPFGPNDGTGYGPAGASGAGEAAAGPADDATGADRGARSGRR